ncbi:competence protein ComEC [Novosphingobium chloroacetimidivorans]|uniref:Competence protein ComEC n=1 Tax=Novosphingobium chloroacetimidivorans TaxID=1428314 RepID=A0A7W7K6G3_9SPHN|nr:ComEC/Rec2 family competence protein [Novosphingobium chloroacetimidivorans]MBB4857051.1 competence protein ComEC [Novosphingobium chloroacetimidivorans]
MSRPLHSAEQFLGGAGFDRAPWLAVAFGTGIVFWFALSSPAEWLTLIALSLGIAVACAACLQPDGRYPYIRLSGIVVPLVLAAGCGSVWMRSHLVGAEPIARPMVATLTGRILAVEPQPAQERTRIVLATREPGSGRAIRVRLNLPDGIGSTGTWRAGALVKMRARLVPPAAPMLPGGYNFARTAWFSGLAATGSALSVPEELEPGRGGVWLNGLQRALNDHVRSQLDPADSGIAAALVTGDMGGISDADTEAMRDSGLAHLLSISGLHVSSVVGAVYVMALRLLALWPWLALRVRLPVVAAGFGALAGLSYTLVSGSQVPTVRSCIGALLVLAALALGREALSLRMLAVAAFLVLLLWPEAVMGPSFQMSFAAVLAIVAVSGAAPTRAFLAPREEGLLVRLLRHLAMVLVTGVVIELALMPIGLYHFHRAGIYGALANMIAIPLTTLVIMPAVLGALVLDLVGLGAPVWWVAGQAVSLLTAIAHWVASRPGSVTVMPAFGGEALALFIAGAVWIGLWSGRVRWFGLLPAGAGVALLLTARPADVLVSGDGRHVGITSNDGAVLYVLRETKSEFVRDNLIEIASMSGEPVLISSWPGARCNTDTCVLVVTRGGRDWRLLLTRSRGALPERSLAAACERVDLVIADRWLPRSCRPRWLKADRDLLRQTGGLAIDLYDPHIRTVAEGEGRHGWWRVAEVPPRKPSRHPPEHPPSSPALQPSR